MTIIVSNLQSRRVTEGSPAWRNGSTRDVGVPDMPFSTRLRVGSELNKAWAEFTSDMHDGPLTGQDVADKFWKFLTGT